MDTHSFFLICTTLEEFFWRNILEIDDDVYILLLNVSIKLNQRKIITNISREKMRTLGRMVHRFYSAFRDALAFQTGNVTLVFATKIHHNKTFDI